MDAEQVAAAPLGMVIDRNTPDVYESTETTHFSIGDKEGNMVSMTQTVNGYFGCGGVAEIPHLQDKCITLAKGGFKHHTAICEGHYKDILKEAFTTYLGYDWVDID